MNESNSERAERITRPPRWSRHSPVYSNDPPTKRSSATTGDGRAHEVSVQLHGESRAAKRSYQATPTVTNNALVASRAIGSARAAVATAARLMDMSTHPVDVDKSWKSQSNRATRYRGSLRRTAKWRPHRTAGCAQEM